MFKFSILLLVLLGTTTISKSNTITYNISTNPDEPESGYIHSDTSSLPFFSIEKPKSSFSNREVAPEVTCVNHSEIFIIEYGKEIACKEIKWPITFNTIPATGIDVSSQINLFSSTSNWWVLFEWNNLPRLAENHEVRVCASSGAENSLVCRKLPERNEPPLIIPWGKFSTQEKNEDLKFTIFSDNAQMVLSSKSRTLFYAQYNYLNNLFPLPTSSENQLDLILVGIDAEKGSIGGAAGSQAFIANYPKNYGNKNQENISRTHWVAAHEMFHIISPYEFPIWISESLAQYYGYKSLIVLGGDTKINPIEMWEKDITRLPHASSGLYQAHEMVSVKQDMSYYPLLYIKGAAFWQKLDELLQTHEQSLDDFLSELTFADLSSGEIPDSFINSVAKIIGRDRYQQLVSQYLNSALSGY